jgi:hypothetical protein
VPRQFYAFAAFGYVTATLVTFFVERDAQASSRRWRAQLRLQN